MRRVCIFILFMFVGVLGTLTAQTEVEGSLVDNTERKGAFNESADIADEKLAEDVPYYFRDHKELPTYFSGYVIELTESEFPLRKDYYLFKRFGSVFIDVLKEGESYSYLITGFDSKKSAQSFLENVVIHQAADAKVIEYKKGKRK